MASENNQSDSSKQADKSSKPTLMLLILAIVVAIAAVVIFKSSLKPPLPPPPSEESLAQKVRRQVERNLSVGLVEESRSLMAAYVQANPNDSEIRPLLARTLLKLNRPTDAELTVDDAIRVAPNDAEIQWLKGELVKARGGANYLKFFRNAADAKIGSGPEIWTRCAVELLAADQDADAQKYLQRAGDAGFKNARYLMGMGTLAHKRNDFVAAQKNLRDAMDFKPPDASVRSDAAAWRMLADCQRRQGAFVEAAQTLEEALTACRSRPGLYLDLGYVRLKLNQMPQAGDAFARAADSRDLRAEASLQAAQAYYAAGRQAQASGTQPSTEFRPYALAMQYIDQAAGLSGLTPEIQSLRTKIEDARFGDPE